jgi:hypothetical protein
MNESEKLNIIQDILREYYENDDSYVVTSIVERIRDKINDNNFAKGASEAFAETFKLWVIGKKDRIQR